MKMLFWRPMSKYKIIMSDISLICMLPHSPRMQRKTKKLKKKWGTKGLLVWSHDKFGFF